MHVLECEPPLRSPVDTPGRQMLRKNIGIEEYLHDASQMPGGSAASVVFPTSEWEVSQYLQAAARSRTPVTIAGNHTGLVGGAVPFGGDVMSTSLFSRVFPERGETVVQIFEGEDELTGIPYGFYLKRNAAHDDICAVTGPGLRLAVFQKEIESKGYFLGPDPTETNAYLGGVISTNASGSRTFKYGSIRPFVSALRIALMDGGILNIVRGQAAASESGQFLVRRGRNEIALDLPCLTMPKTKHAAGYYCKKDMDFIDLWIGSEGTLGAASRVELRLLRKPETVMSAIVFFGRRNAAVDFVDAVRRRAYGAWSTGKPDGLDIRAIEYFDEESLKLQRTSNLGVRIPPRAACAVYFEQESREPIERDLLSGSILSLLTPNGQNEDRRGSFPPHPFIAMMEMLKARGVLDTLELALPGEDREQNRLKEFRHELPVRVNEIIGRNRLESGVKDLHKIGTDTAVPDEYLAPMMEVFHDTLASSGIPYAIFGHIGNNHLHANMLARNASELESSRNLHLGLCKKVVEMSGTVSAEHGIGKLKRRFLEVQFGLEGLRAMAKLKRRLDPLMLLGRGNIFPAEMAQ